MKYLKFILCLLFLSGTCYAQENVKIITYYPAPYAVYKDVRANFFRDLTAPTDYFFDLDGRSKVRYLNVYVPSDHTTEKALLQVGDTLAGSSTERAAIYFKNSGTDRIGICGESSNSTAAGNSYGVYGYAHSTRNTNVGVYGLAEGHAGTFIDDYGVVGRGPAYGFETGVLGKGDKCGILVNTGKTSGIDANDIEYSGVCSYSSTQNGLRSRVYNVGTVRHAGYFRGENGAPALEARGDGSYGLYADSDNNYAGYFKANRNVVKLNAFISTSFATQTDQPYAAEIVGNDDHFVITTDSAAAAWMYVRAPDNEKALFGTATMIAALTSVALVAHPNRYVILPWTGQRIDLDHINSIITATHPIELNPGEQVTSQRIVRFNGEVRIGRRDNFLYDTVHPGDLAEPFDLSDRNNLELGDVVVIDEKGKYLRKSDKKYDPNVAGVISSKKQSALVIGFRKDDENQDKPLALAGKIMCKVDTYDAEIKPGDFLTTSDTPGYAMKAELLLVEDGVAVYPTGTILGVALEGLKKGEKGKILVLAGLE